MLLAIVFFVAGSSVYRHMRPTESPLARVCKVVFAALKNRWRQRQAPRHAPSAISYDDLDQSPGSSMHAAARYQRLIAGNGVLERNSRAMELPSSTSKSFR